MAKKDVQGVELATISFVVPAEKYDAIRDAADREGVTVSELMRRAVSSRVRGLGALTPSRPRKRYERRVCA